MKKHDYRGKILTSRAVLMLWLPFAVSLPGCGGGTKGTGGYDLDGKIYDATGATISGARITVGEPNGQLLADTLSDETGSFAVTDLPADGVSVRVEKASRLLGGTEISLASANQSARLEMRERPDAAGCVDSTLETDSEYQATTRITVWGNLAPYPGIIRGVAELYSKRLLSTTKAEEVPLTPFEPTPLDDLLTQTSSALMIVLVVRDADGKSHDTFLNFVRQDDREFTARVYALASEVEGGVPQGAHFVALGNGVTLRFNQDGTQMDPAGPFDNDDLLRVAWKGVARESEIGLNLSHFTGMEAPNYVGCINTEQ